MIFTTPWMLAGLIALPIVAAVYWFRNRSRSVVVSNLAFWLDQRKPQRGGRILDRMQMPLTFFLELAAIALLVLAAAGPALVREDAVTPLMVVLDDSFSMLTQPPGRGTAPREQAEAAVLAELKGSRYRAKFILAGAKPRVLGEVARSSTDAARALADWTCQSPAADLVGAISLAAELGGPSSRILVLSDHAPPMKLDAGQTRWLAFGGSWPNFAFTAATRTPTGEGERVLLEIANLSNRRAASTLMLAGGKLASPRKTEVQLDPAATRQMFLTLPPGSSTLVATLSNDALAIDNNVTLLASRASPVRVRVDLANADLQVAVSHAIEATGQATIVTERPELAISDSHSDAADDGVWRLEMIATKEAVPLLGPFILDRNHELTKGLSLQTSIWGAASDLPMPGLPIVTAGNVALLSETTSPNGRRDLRMNFQPTASNLTETPEWPILFANLVQWRCRGRFGVPSANARLGETVTVSLPRQIRQVELLTPGQKPVVLPSHAGRVDVSADAIGVHQIKAANDVYEFACNALARDESDLAQCSTGQWGSWKADAVRQQFQVSLNWIFLLGAMAVLLFHAAWLARQSGVSRL